MLWRASLPRDPSAQSLFAASLLLWRDSSGHDPGAIGPCFPTRWPAKLNKWKPVTVGLTGLRNGGSSPTSRSRPTPTSTEGFRTRYEIRRGTASASPRCRARCRTRITGRTAALTCTAGSIQPQLLLGGPRSLGTDLARRGPDWTGRRLHQGSHQVGRRRRQGARGAAGRSPVARPAGCGIVLTRNGSASARAVFLLRALAPAADRAGN
jgi:hypothetical protein